MACTANKYLAISPALAGLAVLVSLLMSCGSSEKNEISQSLDRYYYNYDRFAGPGEVYVYESTQDMALPEEIWHYRFDPGYRGNYLTSTMYTPAGDIVQNSVERLNRDNSELLSLELYYLEDDSLHKIEAKVNKPTTFPFGSIDDLPEIQYSIEYYDVSGDADSVRVILSKTRKVAGRETFYFEGQEVPAVRVDTREVLETETEGFTETEWTGTEIFAQGIGLVYYKKEINDQFTLEYTLRERLTYASFLNRYNVDTLR